MAEIATKVIVLGTPLVVEGESLPRLTMREPLVEDMLEAAEMAGDHATSARLEVCTFARLCDVPLGDLMRMRQADYVLLQEAYGFLARPNLREETSSEEQSSSSASVQDGGAEKSQT